MAYFFLMQIVSGIHFRLQPHQLRGSSKLWHGGQAEGVWGSVKVDVVHQSGAAEERSFEAQSKRGKDISSPFL